MSEFTALVTVIAISLLLSSVTVAAIQAPLRRLLEGVCPSASNAQFWLRAALTLFYLLPLWAVLSFALPGFGQLQAYPASEVMRRGLAAASFALVVIVVATGLRLSSLRPPAR